MTEYEAMNVMGRLRKAMSRRKRKGKVFPALSKEEETAVRETYKKVNPKADIDKDFRTWYPARMGHLGMELIYLCFETKQYRPAD